MQKTHFKMVLLVTMTCLFLAIGTFISGGRALASQNSHPYKSGPKPHITVKILSNTAHLYHHKYMANAVIYGIGFNDCSCNCSNDCSNNGSVPPNYNTAPNTSSCNSCGNDGNVPPNYSPAPNTSSCNSCGNDGNVPPNYSPAPNTSSCNSCGNDGNVPPNYSPAPNASSCNSCGNNGNVPPNYSPTPNASSCNSCGNNGNVPPNYSPAPNTSYNTPSNSTCPSYNDCGTGSNDGCGCNTVNLQSSNADLSAPDTNLSQVPVNTFGEFRIVVQVMPKQAQTAPSVWAINSYNGQSSNTAPVSCCSSSCCQ